MAASEFPDELRRIIWHVEGLRSLIIYTRANPIDFYVQQV
jgi:hypothetical protein